MATSVSCLTDPAKSATCDNSVPKVGVVYPATIEADSSDLTAVLRAGKAAGQPYDILDEKDLADAAKLAQYSGLVFADVQTWRQCRQFLSMTGDKHRSTS